MSSRVSHDAEQYPAVHTPAAQSLSVMIKRELISAPIHPNLKHTYIYIYMTRDFLVHGLRGISWRAERYITTVFLLG